ncbi:MAG: serine hydrolase domain-containing protein [Muribaculaceae bacterium]
MIYMCVGVVALLCTMCGSGDNANGGANRAAVKGEPTAWHDTLSNKASTFAALEPMDRKISRFMDKWDLRGMSVAITRHDSLIFAKGYGWSNAEFGIPLEANMVMRIASSSKLITAVAVMKLCEEGRLSLDSKVFGEKGVLNDTIYSNVISDERLYDLTVDHLLVHKGGFSGRAGDPMFNIKDIMTSNGLSEAPRGSELARAVLRRRLAAAPGEMRRYSNFGYMLLSLVVEKVVDKDYWDYVTCDLLGDVCTGGFYPATNYLSERYDCESQYYAPDTVLVEEYNGSGKMVPRVYGGTDVYGLMGAGGWLASAPAIARLVAVIDGDSRVPDILSASSIAKMTEYDEECPTCRGWSHIEKDGSWMRTGTLYSAHSFVKHFPDGECWVITTNTGVWIGHNFVRQFVQLVDMLRADYGAVMPKQNLWE